jgi:ubiquitin
VETYNDQITQENDHLKREVKKLELKVNKLKKQAKVQPPQDNRSNMVKKFEKEKTHQRLLCEMCYNYLFTDKGVVIFRRSDDFFTFKGVLRGKLYLIDFNPRKLNLIDV